MTSTRTTNAIVNTITATFIISRRLKNSVELGQGKSYKHLKD